VCTGGLIVNVDYGQGQGKGEFATDEAVVWVRGLAGENIVGGFQSTPEDKKEVELYLAGNVIIRTQSVNPNLGQFTQTLRAEQIYYDVSRNRAIALNGDLELGSPRVPDGVHLRGHEIDRLGQNDWEVFDASAFSSKLPSDPGLRLDAPRVTLQERRVVLRNIFGIP